MGNLWSIALGGFLTIVGSIFGQCLIARNENRKWKLEREAQIEDKKNDLRIKMISERSNQIENAMRIITQDFYNIDLFFQRTFRLKVNEHQMDSAKAFVGEKGREMWEKRNPEIQELFNLNAIAYSIGKEDMAIEWDRLLKASNLFVEIANGLIGNFDETYNYYKLNIQTEESILDKTVNMFRDASRKIYEILNDLNTSL